jgi:hypothetical protein
MFQSLTATSLSCNVLEIHPRKTAMPFFVDDRKESIGFWKNARAAQNLLPSKLQRELDLP